MPGEAIIRYIEMNTHYLLAGLNPGDIIIACYAIEAMSRLGKLHGHPISREEAEKWLKAATPNSRCNADWLQWRLDGIEDLVDA